MMTWNDCGFLGNNLELICQCLSLSFIIIIIPPSSLQTCDVFMVSHPCIK